MSPTREMLSSLRWWANSVGNATLVVPCFLLCKAYINSTVAMLTPPPISTTQKIKIKIQRVDKV